MVNKKITILDGGMGKQLELMGAPFRRPEWSALALIEAPEFVARAHDDYINAGADVIITNSYALVPFHIGQERFDIKGRELIQLSAKIARECANKSKQDVKVAGSIPPPFGSYRPDLYIEEKADDIYIPLIEEQDEYIDFWLAETVSSLKEAKKIAKLLEDNNKPLWISYTVKDGSNTPQLRSEEPIEDAVRCAVDIGAEAILINCSQPEAITPALEVIKKMDISKPFGVYANAFEPIKRDQDASSESTTLREDTTPEAYLNVAQTWKDIGAVIIGGCCGIGPEHIKELTKLNQE